MHKILYPLLKLWQADEDALSKTRNFWHVGKYLKSLLQYSNDPEKYYVL